MIVTQPHQRRLYQEATKISVDILAQVRDRTVAGVYPYELNQLAEKLCQQYQVTPSFAPVTNHLGRYGYAMCISINDTVLHGIPSKTEALKEGDIVKLDFGIVYQELHTDLCVTIGVKRLSKKNRRLVEVCREAVQSAVALAQTGNTTGDLGATMQRTAKQAGFKVLKQYVGHGIGYQLHESPQIPAYGIPNGGSRLKTGMVLCIEAQVVAGSDEVFTSDDEWSVKTSDGKKSAMFEYMVIVGPDNPELLTPTYDWPLIVS